MSRKIAAFFFCLLLLSMASPAQLAQAEANGECQTHNRDKTGVGCGAATTLPGSDQVHQPIPHLPPAEPVPLGVPVREACYRLNPQPPIDSRDGLSTADGAYFQCKLFDSGDNVVGGQTRWIPKDQTPPSADKPPVDMKKLAQTATAKLHFEAPQIGIVPRTGQGIIGVPVWLWVANPSPATVGPLTETATEGEAKVSIRARMQKIIWDMGDGTTITCREGTPWKPEYKANPSPTCGHTYQKRGTYTITGTVYWAVDWEGDDQHGTLTPTLKTTPTTLVMRDVQVLNTSPNK